MKNTKVEVTRAVLNIPEGHAGVDAAKTIAGEEHVKHMEKAAAGINETNKKLAEVNSEARQRMQAKAAGQKVTAPEKASEPTKISRLGR